MTLLPILSSVVAGIIVGFITYKLTINSRRFDLLSNPANYHLHDAVIYEMARKQALWLALVFAILGFVIVFYAFAA